MHFTSAKYTLETPDGVYGPRLVNVTVPFVVVPPVVALKAGGDAPDVPAVVTR